MTFNEKLTKLRKANSMSQEELAEKVNVSRQAVSKWELGDAIPDSDKIIALSNVFGVTTDYLLKDEIEIPNATILMYKKPNRNDIIGNMLKYLSTPIYAIGMIIAWIIWSNFCKYEGGNTNIAMGKTSFFVGLLIQGIGFTCYLVGKKLNNTKLSPWHKFWNAVFLLFMPMSMIFTASLDCFSGGYAAAPYPCFEVLWISMVFCGGYVFIMAVTALILHHRLNKKKYNTATQNQEEKQTLEQIQNK